MVENQRISHETYRFVKETGMLQKRARKKPHRNIFGRSTPQERSRIEEQNAKDVQNICRGAYMDEDKGYSSHLTLERFNRSK